MNENGKNPLVTVIIATFNSSRTLKIALSSALSQDFSDFEIRVVGDRCTDDSEKVVESFNDKRVHWINLPVNSGSQGVPNNEGIKNARGKFIAYLGHDDIWFPWHLTSLVEFIRKTGADLVHPLSAVFSPEGLEYIVGPPGFGKDYDDHFVTPSCWLHRKEIINECGLWGDHLKLERGVDFDFLRRIHLKGKKIAFYPGLSHLKFPSWLWGTYKKDFDPIQKKYFNKLKTDPLKLEKEIFIEAAIKFSKKKFSQIPLRQDVYEFIKRNIRRLSDLYGREKWPLKNILVQRFQRNRKRFRRKRGLN